MTLVLDASALFTALTGGTRRAELQARLSHERCHAPHLVDAEIGHALRREVLRGAMAASAAAVWLKASARLVDERHEMSGELAEDAWALRENLTFYDALYAALAMQLQVPLLTADARLARAPGLDCEVVLVER